MSNVPIHISATLVVFLLMLAVVGWITGRKNKDANDYLVASHSLPLWMAVLTMTATMFGGGMLVARATWGYRAGAVFFIYGVGSCVSRLLLAWLLPRFTNFSKYTTVTQFLEDRYRSRLIRTVCATLSLIACIAYTASQVGALVSILTAMGFENPRMVAFVCMVIIIALTVFGGMLAVSATDSVQMIIIIAGIVILTVVVWVRNGGYGNIVAELTARASELPEHYLEPLHPSNLNLITWMVLPSIMNSLIEQAGYQRLFACKDLRDARRASAITGVLMCACASAPVMFGMVARLHFPNLENPNPVLAMIILEYLPGVMSGVLLCAILAAILSTGDSFLSSATSHFITDFWCVFVDKDADLSSKKMLTISRVFTLIAGVVALLFSYTLTDVLSNIIDAMILYTAGAFVPIILGVLWKGANRIGATIGMFAGMAMCAFGMLTGFHFGPVPAELTSVLVSLIVTVIVSLATAKTDPPIVVAAEE